MYDDYDDDLGSDDRARSFPVFPPGRRAPRKFARTWWGNAWIDAMEDAALDQEQLRRGRKYAHTGHVGMITVGPGRISAEVHDGDQYCTFETVVRIDELSDAGWDRFLAKVAARAGHMAALLDKEMPPDLVRSADDAGVRLLPGFGDLDPECDCPGWELPCKHAAALLYQASWLLDTDPFVLLLMRGRGEEELIEDLRRRNEQRAPREGAVAERPGDDAAEAFRAEVGRLPAPPPIAVGDVQDVGALLAEAALPEDPGIVVDPVALGILVADAAQWARALFRGEADPRAAAAWPDSVRLAAAGLPEELRRRLGPARELDTAVRAWRYAGADGLAVLEESWSPDRLTVTRVAQQLEEALEDGVLEKAPAVWRNRWTFREDAQLRLGRDGRWYPFRREASGWCPAGPPERDLTSAVVELLTGVEPVLA